MAARTIGAGKTATLAFEFESNACTDQSGYTINVQFSSGCSANLAPAANCQAAGGSALTVNGKKVSWTITNNGGDSSGHRRNRPDMAPGKWERGEGDAGWSRNILTGPACSFGKLLLRLERNPVGPQHSAGQARILTFEFQNAASPNGYTINVRLNPGCSLSFPGP